VIRPAACYSISQAAQLAGVTPELIRAWERRYGLVQPQRAAGGRRAYTRLDVERLRLLRAAVGAGHAIGQIHALGQAELRGLAAPAPPDARRRARDIDELERLAATLGPRAFVLEVVTPTLAAVAGRPERHVLGPAVRHLCAALLRTLRRPGPPDLLLAATGEEGDLLPAAVLAAAHGRSVLYLGAQVEPEQIAARAAPTVLVRATEIDRVAELLPPQVDLWVLGPAANRAPASCVALFSMADLDSELG